MITVKEKHSHYVTYCHCACVASLRLFFDADHERNCATKELPTARWRRERRCRDKLGDYTKLQQNKSTHDRYCVNPHHFGRTYIKCHFQIQDSYVGRSYRLPKFPCKMAFNCHLSCLIINTAFCYKMNVFLCVLCTNCIK